MKPSYPNKGNLVPVDGRELRDELQAAILPFPTKHVAEAAKRTPEAVKKWRAGLSCPDLESALNMAQGIPAVKWLIQRRIQAGAPEGIFSTRTVVEALSLLQQIADSNSEHAATARKILGGQA